MLNSHTGEMLGSGHADSSINHDFCRTDTSDRHGIWNRVLDLQVDLFFEREWRALSRFQGWSRAQSVLDIGCGNGRFLQKLRSVFPQKTYCGLDQSPQFVADAKHHDTDITFLNGDFFAPFSDATFDVVLMRFVVQHLKDWRAILRRAENLLSPNGSLIVVEPHLGGFGNSPPLPCFGAMLEAYGREAAARGCLRAGLDELASRASSEAWQVSTDQTIEVVFRDAARKQVLTLYRAWTDLCEAAAYVKADFPAIREELDGWGRYNDGTSRISLRLLELQPSRLA